MIAIVDVETTGLSPYRNDRILEIAVVLVDHFGNVIREYATLVNPERDVGPTSIHGMTSADVLHAPVFSDVCTDVLAAMSGACVVGGHNIRFDNAFIRSEFNRIGVSLPDYRQLCTMRLAGGESLAACCDCYGIEYDGVVHHALHDARSTGKLLARLVEETPDIIFEWASLSPITWPQLGPSSKPPVSRSESKVRQHERMSYLQRLVSLLPSKEVMIVPCSAFHEYRDLLDRVLEDRRVDEMEANALTEIALRWGFSGSQVECIHHEYCLELAVAALEDGVVTETERNDLLTVVKLFGRDSSYLNGVLESARVYLVEQNKSMTRFVEKESLAGSRVCFTGEFQSKYCGEVITRENAEQLSRKAGLEVASSVTKSSISLSLPILVHNQVKQRKQGSMVLEFFMRQYSSR
jgi:DNA polymerase-3 subunit epsilon